MQKSGAMRCPWWASTTPPSPAPLLPKAAGLMRRRSVIPKANCQGTSSSQPCKCKSGRPAEKSQFRVFLLYPNEKGARSQDLQTHSLFGAQASGGSSLHGAPRQRGSHQTSRAWAEVVADTALMYSHVHEHLLVANWESNKTVFRRGEKKKVFLHCNPVKKPTSSALVHTQKCCSCLAPGMRISLLQKTYLTL